MLVKPSTAHCLSVSVMARSKQIINWLLKVGPRRQQVRWGNNKAWAKHKKSTGLDKGLKKIEIFPFYLWLPVGIGSDINDDDDYRHKYLFIRFKLSNNCLITLNSRNTCNNLNDSCFYNCMTSCSSIPREWKAGSTLWSYWVSNPCPSVLYTHALPFNHQPAPVFA